jgi:transposase
VVAPSLIPEGSGDRVKTGKRDSRRAGASPDTLARSWKAQRRLHARYIHLASHGKTPPEAVTAVARELAGFTWGR